MFGNSPYMGNYIKPVLLRTNNDELSPSKDAWRNEGPKPVEEDNADEDHEDRNEAERDKGVQANEGEEEFDQYGSQLPKHHDAQADDKDDHQSLSNNDTTDDEDDPDYNMMELRWIRQQPPANHRGKDSCSVDISPPPIPRGKDSRSVENSPPRLLRSSLGYL